MKKIVTKENLEMQCKDYQENLGTFANRELVGIFRRKVMCAYFGVNGTQSQMMSF
ncbi:hypothetical protein JYU18_00095 [bacterium AH-315-E07]|nr:hypothetical protein [bacterium AH-315-E07]